MSKFLQDVVMVVILNDLKYLLSFYLIGMQNALVEDHTIGHLNLLHSKEAAHYGGGDIGQRQDTGANQPGDIEGQLEIMESLYE